ncbi:universal stress protein [Olivibacter sitiensis]|uniref:universal stress protein n=1 Tax=Olivibacter sitiensis TaxID=376470 RepID=UPI00040D7892|nr:universal stress protein [Olivibacter sitiensis]
MKTFIVATDFSSVAENAIEYAGALAQQIGAQVVLYNSFLLPSHAANARLHANQVQKLIDENSAKLQRRADELAATYQIEVSTHVGFLSFLEDDLANLAIEKKADLLVMGMASKSLEQDILGNTTTTAISKLKCPVLAVPPGVSFHGIKNVLFACDMLRGVQKQVLDRIKELASSLGANIEIFSVSKKLVKLEENSPYMNSQAAIDEGLDGVSYYYKNVESGAIIDEIRKEVQASNADLLVMLPNKYGFWASLVHRSKTRIMASRSAVPLLSIPL